MAKRNLAKQSRKYRARRIIQTLQNAKNKNDGCLTLLVKLKREQNVTDKSGMRTWKNTLEENIRMRK